MALFNDIEARIRRIAARGLGLALAGLVFVAAAGFLLAALFLALSMVMEPVFACLATAGVLLAIALAILAFASRAAPPAKSAQGPPPTEPSLAALLAGEQLAGSTRRWLSEHRGESVIALFGLGFAVGFSPRLRRAVVRWLRG